MKVSIIAAMAEGSRAIGLRGDLPWHLPADMARFRKLTMGHAVIIGRRTWEPIAGRGLPGRRVIVLSRAGILPESANAVAGSLEEGLQIASQEAEESEVFIAGGAQVYEEALKKERVDRMHLTIVHGEFDADSFFPEYASSDWEIVESKVRAADENNPYRMTFNLLERF